MTLKDHEDQRPEEAAGSAEATQPSVETPPTEPAPPQPAPETAETDSTAEAPAPETPESTSKTEDAATETTEATEDAGAPETPESDSEPQAADPDTGSEPVVAEMTPPTPAEPAPTVEAPATEAVAQDATGAKKNDEAKDGASPTPQETDPEVARALKRAAASVGPTLRAGKRLKVTIVQVGEKDSFVDFGGRSEGTIATSELKDEKGELKYNVGDEINAVVRKVDNTPVFTLGRRRIPANLGKVKEAFENQVPLEGKVKSTNKGGFEIDLHGVRAFCPFSQIQLGYCDHPEEYVGQKLPFLVITFERGGRNIVLSRRKLLQEESKAAMGDTLEKLEEGAVFEGVVRRLQPYGAFVDIGGIDGLVHVSEISHGRVLNPQDVLKVGDKVHVKVIKLEGEGNKRRISLSMKELEDDPWEKIEDHFVPGASVPGKVVRLTDFGAFVELEKGVDGLIHISEISTERIQHPSEKLQKGQEVEVRVLKVDPQQRRISLSLLSEEESLAAHQRRGPRRGHHGGEDGESMRHHRSSTPEVEEETKPDLTKMPFEDALQALKNKFRGD